jgi:hypothetical protein
MDLLDKIFQAQSLLSFFSPTCPKLLLLFWSYVVSLNPARGEVRFSTIFQLYFGGQFYWRKPELPEKTTDLPQVTDKLDHIMLH